MIDLYDSKTYVNEILKETNKHIYNDFKNSSFLITGGTGLILSYFVDVLLANPNFSGKLTLVVRNLETAKNRFRKYLGDERLTFINVALSKIHEVEFNDDIDYVISGASITSPTGYASYPADVILDNIVGLKNLLEVAKIKKSTVILLSSSEVYGINESPTLEEESSSIFKVYEQRSCYNLAKAICENLCIAYLGQFNVHYQIIRPSRIFGPTMKIDDSKALSQFIKNVLNDEDIVIRSKGEQEFNYQYVADTVRAISYIIANGKLDNIYNCTSNESTTLFNLATLIARISNKDVKFDLNDNLNGKGYSKTSRSIMSVDKLHSLGYKDNYTIEEGIKNTLKILKEIYH